MEREIHVGGDAPVRRARLELAPVDGGPVPVDSCRDIAERSEAAGQVVLTGMQAQIQEQVLGREHPMAPHLSVVTGTSARSGVAVPVKDVLAASVVPSETAVHETTVVRASSSNGR